MRLFSLSFLLVISSIQPVVFSNSNVEISQFSTFIFSQEKYPLDSISVYNFSFGKFSAIFLSSIGINEEKKRERVREREFEIFGVFEYLRFRQTDRQTNYLYQDFQNLMQFRRKNKWVSIYSRGCRLKKKIKSCSNKWMRNDK